MPRHTKKPTKDLILYIDTTDNDLAVLALFDGKETLWEKFEFLPSAEDFPSLVKKFLKSHGLNFSDLSRIAVKVGPGFFSRVRTGIVAANALSYALAIPVVGVSGSVDFDKIRKAKPKGSALPVYGAKPHITVPKKVR